MPHFCAFLPGAWATAAARVAAKNLSKDDRKAVFKPTIKMWVFEEEFRERKLSELINECHENVKYLPGVSLPDNLVACADLQVSPPSNVLAICLIIKAYIQGVCTLQSGTDICFVVIFHPLQPVSQCRRWFETPLCWSFARLTNLCLIYASSCGGRWTPLL